MKVQYFGVYYDQGLIHLVMEYMDGGSLDLVIKKAGKIGEKYLRKITYAVLRGLSYLREKHQIIHRSGLSPAVRLKLKIKNCLLAEM